MIATGYKGLGWVAYDATYHRKATRTKSLAWGTAFSPKDCWLLPTVKSTVIAQGVSWSCSLLHRSGLPGWKRVPLLLLLMTGAGV